MLWTRRRCSRMPKPTATSFARRGRRQPGKRHGRADERVGLCLRSPDADAEIGEDPVKALDEKETEDGQIAEPAAWRFPPSIQEVHPNSAESRTSC